MGTGKTSVGQIIASKLNLNFIDTDILIEEEAGISISRIFSRHGEDYFRSLEGKILAAVVNDRNDFVLSTGGGIVISPQNRKLLLNQTKAFLLKASPEEIYRRTKDDENRPLLAGETPLSNIRGLIKARTDFYNKFTNKIETENKSPCEVAEEIIFLLINETSL